MSYHVDYVDYVHIWTSRRILIHFSKTFLHTQQIPSLNENVIFEPESENLSFVVSADVAYKGLEAIFTFFSNEKKFSFGNQKRARNSQIFPFLFPFREIFHSLKLILVIYYQHFSFKLIATLEQFNLKYKTSAVEVHISHNNFPFFKLHYEQKKMRKISLRSAVNI